MPSPGALLRRAEPCMGTMFSFAVVADPTPDAAFEAPSYATTARIDAAIDDAMALMHRLDMAWSPFLEDSFVGRIRAGETLDSREDDPDGLLGIDLVLRRCRAAQRLTNGAFDAWSLPGGFDPSGLVKGWAVERAVDVLARHSLHHVAVSGGGDVVVRGDAPGRAGWRVGLRHPEDRERLLARCVVDGGGAVATSGIYERGRHVSDAREGADALGPLHSTLVGVSVIGPELGWADAIATALLAEGTVSPPWLLQVPTYRALGIDEDGTLSGMLLDEVELFETSRVKSSAV